MSTFKGRKRLHVFCNTASIVAGVRLRCGAAEDFEKLTGLRDSRKVTVCETILGRNACLPDVKEVLSPQHEKNSEKRTGNQKTGDHVCHPL